jgi:cellulose synthase/poly-beta-1,6-N-acetylglucosamine synthase-like glycosyltransferase
VLAFTRSRPPADNATAFTIYVNVPHTLDGWKHIVDLVEKNKVFRELTISVAATYGLYFIGSFMHMEPWHMWVEPYDSLGFHTDKSFA